MMEAHVAQLDSARLSLLGFPVDRLNMRAALDWMAAAIAAARATNAPAPTAPTESAAQAAPTRQIVTLNPEMVMAARRNPELRSAILSADLVVPDGVGLLWAARLAGESFPARVPGVDLLERFAERAASAGYRIYLLGAAEGVAERVQRQLEQRYPGVVICGVYAGSPSQKEEADLCARIRAARPDALFVAFGVPAQECWLAHNRDRLGAAVAIGVGGAFDFLAGVAPRAPDRLRRLGLEWAYRLWREPWRWRRMLALPRFALAALLAGISHRISQRVS